MRKEYLDIIPQWYKSEKQFDLVLSDDIDSLASCAVLKQAKGWNIKHFYNFEQEYASKQQTNNEKVWVDTAVLNGKAFDNHVSKVDMYDKWNREMINLNSTFYISNNSYENKYAGSTLLEVWSIYNIPLPKTEEGMMILMSIDAAYKGFFSDKFHDTQKRYLVDVLGFKKLYECVMRHKQEEFIDIIIKYQLNDTITMVDGKLHTKMDLSEISRLLGINIELPEDEFELTQEFNIVEDKIPVWMPYASLVSKKLFTLAFTYKSNVRYSEYKEN